MGAPLSDSTHAYDHAALLARYAPSFHIGPVRATVTGALRVLSIEIEEAFFKSGDKEMIQDLSAAAINAAIAKAQEGANEEYLRMQQHLMHGSGF